VDGQVAEAEPVAEVEVVAEAEPVAEVEPVAAETYEVVGAGDSPAEADESTVDDEGEPTLDLVDPDRLRAAVEAVLLVVDQPIDATSLAQTLAVPQPDVEGALRALRAEYDEGARGMDLREIAGGWRLYSRDDFAAYVERFVLDGQQTRMTQAALETLAVIAYRQPVTRSRVSAIRGVGVDAVMRTLTTRALIEECGTDPETTGGLYRTTPLFLEKLGLNSLDELPPLAPLLPDHTDLDPTITDD
jgi:segregation and condensation protein B